MIHDPIASLQPREVLCCIEPLRLLVATCRAAPTITAVEALEIAIRRVALGLQRLSEQPDLHIDQPTHFTESVR